MKWLQSLKIGLIFTGVLSFAIAAPATEDTWTYKADIPTTRTWVGGCVLDGKIYVIGGARSDSSATAVVEMYDPLLDTWTIMANMPSARCYHATCTFKGKIYVFGGAPGVWSTADKSVFLYDPQTGIWTQKADMPYAIGSSGIAVIDTTIYLIGGGLTANSPGVATVMAYDPVAESWIQKADMPTARMCFSACVVDGKIYAIGGCKEDWQTFAYKLVEVYDPSTNTWTRKADMPTERWSPSACVVDGEIHVIGGNANNLQPTPAHEVYDPLTDTWTTKAPMQQKRLGHFVGLVGNKIYAIGGHYPMLIMVPKTEEYDTGLTLMPSPDFNGDGVINLEDFAMLIQYWGEDEPSVDIAPPSGDGIVDFRDLAVFAEHYRLAGRPFPAGNPNPADGSIGVSTAAFLSWTAGEGAASHEVYFGAAYPLPLVSTETDTTYPPPVMTKNTTYYWRIDEVNSKGKTTGQIWSFRTETGVVR